LSVHRRFAVEAEGTVRRGIPGAGVGGERRLWRLRLLRQVSLELGFELRGAGEDIVFDHFRALGE
jgi:hypothetical protein